MSTDPIAHEFTVAAPPERAFELFVRIGQWWDRRYTADPATFSDVEVDGRVGGAVTEVHTGGDRIPWGAVTAWEPGERFAYTSTLAQTREHPSEITVEFAAEGTGTRVRFAHGGWHAGNAADRAKFSDWAAILAGYAATCPPPPRK